MNRAFVYLQQPESRARTTQRTCRSVTLSTSFKCSPIVRLPHPEERLAIGQENVGQEGFDALVHRVSPPPVSLADSPFAAEGPAPGQRRPLVVSGAPRLRGGGSSSGSLAMLAAICRGILLGQPLRFEGMI